MSKNSNIGTSLLVFVILVLGGLNSQLTAQEDEPLTTRVDLTCVQTLDAPIQLVAKLRAKEGRSYIAVKGETISFAIVTSEDYITIGESVTDLNGDAKIFIEDNSQLEKDEDGYYTVSAEYEGSDKYEDNSEEFYFKLAYILMETSEDEDGKIVETTAYEITDEEEVPIVDVELKVSIPRMFSSLPIGVDYTDDDGYLSFEFPDDIPGDTEGYIEIMAEILDSDDYGILRQKETKQWGIPKKEVIEASRSLWTPDAPLWMVITFSILMIAVWGHFVYIIYRLVLLKNEGDVEVN